MSGIWKRIDEEKPQQGQAVYYWFGVFDQVYAGFYKDGSQDEEWCANNYFYCKGGFLGDDVTWWMPRDELPEGVTFSPAPPTDEQKAQCRYHPVRTDKGSKEE